MFRRLVVVFSMVTVCGLVGGARVPVGADSGNGQPGVRRGAEAVIAGGGYHSCAVLANGTVKCWGFGVYGQLGQGSTANLGDQANEMGDQLPPVNLGSGRTATAVTAGFVHTCALLDNGTVKCWGYNGEGELGQSSTANLGDQPNEMGDQLPPINLGTGRTATAISSGSYFTCALLDNGTVKCWGSNTYGQLGQGSTADLGNDPNEMGDQLAPVDLGSGRTATAISAGNFFACAVLDNGTVKCWGANTYGQVGQGSAVTVGDQPNEMGDFLAPVSLGSGRTATAIGGGGYHTCALLDNGTVKCWGYNSEGELGQGSTVNLGDQPNEMGDHLAPVDLGSGRTATAISGGSYHTCALLNNGTVKCWGYSGDGELGKDSMVGLGKQPNEMGDFLAPVNLGVGRTALAVTVGDIHTCALLDNGALKCWGYNGYGALGLQNTSTMGDQPGEMAALVPVSLGAGSGALVVPAVVAPAQPVGVVGTAGAQSVALSWTAPTDNGGAAVTGYRIDVSVDGGVHWTTAVANTGSPSTSRTISGLTAGQAVVLRVAAINSRGAGVPSAPSAPIAYASLDPARLLDTRVDGATVDGQFLPKTKLAGGQEIALQVTGRGGVPAGAAAVVLNVTVTDPEAPGFVTVYPCGTTRPNASNLNFTAGETIPNNVVVKVGANGTVCLFSQQTTNLIADINGAFTGSGYTPLDPARLLDTRVDGATVDGQFLPKTKLAGGQEIALQVTGRGGVPAGAAAVVLNVTVTDPEAPGFVTVYPCGTTRPNASNLNFTAGETIPNNVVVKVGANGTVCLFSQQTTNLIADINGAFTGSGYTPLDPARLLDTRVDGATVDGQFLPKTKLAGGQEIALQVTGRGGVPAGAAAVVLNVTVTDPEAPGFVTVYPCGTTRPNASNLNFTAGETIPNNVVVKVGANGTVCLFSQQTTNLIADINGALI